jgi:DNA polymerase-1
MHTLNYGMKAPLLAKNLRCSVPDAEMLIEKYFERYPTVAHFYQDAIAETEATGFASSVLGRRRFLPEIASGNEGDRWRAQRQAVNMQIQGSAADVVRMAMILIDEADLESKYGCKMLMQVHDELVFECPTETAKEAYAEIKMWMEHPLASDLDVPLTVEGSVALNWLEAK